MPRNDVLKIETGRGACAMRIEGIESGRVADVVERIDPREDARRRGVVADNEGQIAGTDFDDLPRAFRRGVRRPSGCRQSGQENERDRRPFEPSPA